MPPSGIASPSREGKGNSGPVRPEANEKMKLHCTNLVKKYGVRTVVKGVSMEINQGEIVGFLGPSGAGQTTSF